MVFAPVRRVSRIFRQFKVFLRRSPKIHIGCIAHFEMIQLQKIQWTVSLELVDFEQKQVFRRARGRHIQRIRAFVYREFRRVIREIRMVESHDKHVFTLSTFYRMKRRKHHLPINDFFVDLLRLEHGNITWNIALYQGVFHFTNGPFFHRRRQNENITGKRTRLE